MKPPVPERHNRKVLRILKAIALAPITLSVSLYHAVRRWMRSGRSDERVRSDDQVRQSRARRELRGLPPDHVQDPGGGPS